MLTELQKIFGNNVRRLREAQGLTQAELASKAGINRSYLGGVERGQRRIGMENIAKIAAALAVSADILFKITESES
jgi:transcriptional regulator with XRE-family HTH domain